MNVGRVGEGSGDLLPRLLQFLTEPVAQRRFPWEIEEAARAPTYGGQDCRRTHFSAVELYGTPALHLILFMAGANRTPARRDGCQADRCARDRVHSKPPKGRSVNSVKLGQPVAIRPFTPEEALSHLKANTHLLGNVSAMAKAWRRSRSTVREWQKAWQQQGDRPTSVRKTGPLSVEPALPPPEAASPAFDVAAYIAAISLAGVAAYLSISGLVVLFPGAPAAVAAMAATMETAKLIAAGWLGRHWRSTSWSLRVVLIALVVGLAIVNAVGVYGRLVEAHVGITVAATSSVVERIGALDARLEAQEKTVADADRRLDEINAAIAKLTEKGRPGAALDAIANQRRLREGLVATRRKESGLLVELRSDRAALEAQRRRVEALNGPIQYIAAMVGVDVERAIRWLMLLMVLTCDPLAIALMVAAAGNWSHGGQQHVLSLEGGRAR